jgi:hypothetical protein
MGSRAAAGAGILRGVVVIQRVRIRWGADSRGAAHADRRHGLPEAYLLPTLTTEPAGPVLVHDVLLDEAAEYQPTFHVLEGRGAAGAARLWVERAGEVVTVDRLPSQAAYPVRRLPVRLFTLTADRIGRHRTNFRSTGCACAPQWFYEQWTTHVANASPSADMFLDPHAARDIDDRVHLYGGPKRRAARSIRLESR